MNIVTATIQTGLSKNTKYFPQYTSQPVEEMQTHREPSTGETTGVSCFFQTALGEGVHESIMCRTQVSYANDSNSKKEKASYISWSKAVH